MFVLTSLSLNYFSQKLIILVKRPQFTERKSLNFKLNVDEQKGIRKTLAKFVIKLDFAQFYSLTVQDAPQPFHYTDFQAKTHPVLIYY